MLDIVKIRDQADFFKVNLARKGVEPSSIDELLSLDHKKRELQTTIQNLKKTQNEGSKELKKLDNTARITFLIKMKDLANQRKTLETELTSVIANYKKVLLELPNTADEAVPTGKTDEENVTIRTEGELPKFDFQPQEHWAIAENLGLLDMERAAKVSGSRFYYMFDELALLQMAIMQWGFLTATAQGFRPTIPPFMVRKAAMAGTGFLSHAEQNEIYRVNPTSDDLYLVGTAEVPLISYHTDTIIDEADLPIKFAGYSPCFRREAGSYGKDTKGILRVHQFEKIEMVVVCSPENSEALHSELLAVEEHILQELGLPYRVMDICGGDLGMSAARKYDLEAYLAGTGKYRELTSTSNCRDYQARRLNIKIRRKNGELTYAHTLNGTVLSSRPLVAILENFQNNTGGLDIPEVLWPFMGGIQEIKPRT